MALYAHTTHIAEHHGWIRKQIEWLVRVGRGGRLEKSAAGREGWLVRERVVCGK